MRKLAKHLKELRRPGRANAPRAGQRQAHRNLVSGRGARRPARHAEQAWARRGSRPPAPRRYDWAYVFGAVCPARAASAALVLPEANAEMMNLHLQEIGRHVAEGAHAVVVLDGAGWHGAKALAIPDNISLVVLPAYSPELNPIENVLALPAAELSLQPRIRRLRRHRRRLLRCLARLRSADRRRHVSHSARVSEGQRLGPLV